VTRHVKLREFLVGVEGLAVLRQLFVGDDEAVTARIAEVRRIVGEAEENTFGLATDVPELDVRAGYAAWSETYDGPGNPLIAAEQPVVWALLDRLPPRSALDAACGTGRHARHLVDLGHDVVGIDVTPEMIVRARASVPGARFALGDLAALPVPSASFELVVCSLAFDHVADIAPPVAELARVARPGGRVVISDIHPVASATGGTAFFRRADGSNAFMRNHGHLHGDYLRAFHRAGLEVRECLEPRFDSAQVEMQGLAHAFVPDAATAAFLGLPGALVWELVRSSA
jgi:SAM-dependent methyltransferase